GVSTPAMAAAVSNAGGLGAIGVGATDAETARQMIRAVRTASDRPFNVNVFCHRPAVRDSTREAVWLSRLSPIFSQYGAVPPSGLREIYTSFVEDDAMLAMLLEERPKVVSFHAAVQETCVDHGLGNILVTQEFRTMRMTAPTKLPAFYPPRAAQSNQSKASCPR